MATAYTYKPISWIILRNDGLTLSASSQEFRVRGHGEVKNPRTPDQVRSRVFLTNAKRLWSTLSPADKKAWSLYAQENIVTNKREHFVIGRGIDGFVRSSITRQTAGLDPLPALPGRYSPQGPTALDLLPGANARELVFRIEHEISDPDKHAMLVRMTPTGKSVACSPYPNMLRHVRGVGKDSVIPLPESGTVVRIPDTRFALVPEHSYAIEVRIVRLADGTVSDARYQAAMREEAAEADVAVIAAVQTFGITGKKSKPPAGAGVAVRKPAVGRDAATGQFTSSKTEIDLPNDPDFSAEENARLQEDFIDMFGGQPKSFRQEIAAKLPRFMRIDDDGTQKPLPPEGGTTNSEGGTSSTQAVRAGDGKRDGDEVVDRIDGAQAAHPGDATHSEPPALPPVPPGKRAVRQAPGVTVWEEAHELAYLAEKRGLIYFPSAYVQREHCRGPK